MPAPEQKEDIEKAKDILNKHADRIKKECLVDQMGVGYKIKDGKLTNEVALIFYVKKKKTREELLSEGVMAIPEIIDGFPTDVVEIPGGFKPRITSKK